MNIKFIEIFVLSLIYINYVKGRLFLNGSVPDWKIIGKAKTAGNRLFLSPLIEGGDQMKARRLAKVDSSQFLNISSYSGFITVNSEYNSNLWFWFFPAEGTSHLYESDNTHNYADDINEDYNYDYYENDEKEIKKNSSIKGDEWKNENKPLILWLQGGPGSSGLFGLFTEIGPFFVNDDGISLKENKYSWHKNYSIIFIDNPVGTGFSFTKNVNGYATEVKQVGKELYIFLIQFLKMFPWLKHLELFIVGESFAGKYIPSIGFEIFTKNNDTRSEFKINLQGLAIGNGYSDPPNMFKYSEYVYQLGLVDIHGRREMELFEIFAEEFVHKPESKIYWDLILGTFLKHSHYTNVYNVLQPKALILDSYLTFIDQPHIRKSIHVGVEEFSSPIIVYYSLINDFMTSAMNEVERLLEDGLRIMFYSGSLDLIVAYPLSENAFQHMHWSKINQYKDSYRFPFIINNTLVGYIKQYDNFADILVLNAGHMVPTDQPNVSMELINRFTANKL